MATHAWLRNSQTKNPCAQLRSSKVRVKEKSESRYYGWKRHRLELKDTEKTMPECCSNAVVTDTLSFLCIEIRVIFAARTAWGTSFVLTPIMNTVLIFARDLAWIRIRVNRNWRAGCGRFARRAATVGGRREQLGSFDLLWVLSLPLHDRKMLAVMLMETLQNRTNIKSTDTALEAAWIN